MTQSNLFVFSEKYVALWHIIATKAPRDQLSKVKTNLPYIFVFLISQKRLQVSNPILTSI